MNTQRQENFSSENPENVNVFISRPNKVVPSDRELEWDRSKVLSSKTDVKGNILYVNEAFIDVCGYDDYEIINQPHSLLRHPDMPKVIYKLLWEKLQEEKSTCVVMKNMSKTGRYYWVVNDIKCGKDSVGDICFTGRQQSVSNNVIFNHIEPLYKKLLQIENSAGLQASENYLIGFLEDKNKTLFEYITGLVLNCTTESEDDDAVVGKVQSKKGFFSGFFAEK